MSLRWRTGAMASVAALALTCVGACSGTQPDEGPPRSVRPDRASEQAMPVASDVGPFAGLRWPGAAVPMRAVLHDDGTRMWSIALRGERTLIWRHPQALVSAIGPAPGGGRLAVSVGLQPRTASEPSFALYLLEADGSIRTVDVVHGFRSIDAPTFLRPPSRSHGPPRLYWIRTGEAVGIRDGRLETQVMVDDEGPREVRVPLRFAEAVTDLAAYPGGRTFTISLFRQNDVPTRLEILRNMDAFHSTDASLTLWGNNEARTQTDVFVGVAWISPTDYVVPVASGVYPRGYQLRLFRAGCERLGSTVVFEGTSIDWGYAEQPWHLLPAGGHGVLLLGAAQMRRVARGKAKKARWLRLDVSEGDINATGIEWEPGAWTWVSPPASVDLRHRPDCDGFDWSWP
jgi:hypothetical protein